MAGGENKTDGMWERIRNLCETCKERGIILNPDKFHVGRKIELGGFQVERKILEEGRGSTEIRPQAHQINRVTEFPVPNTRKELQCFMGCINILRNWTDQISSSSPTLRQLMSEKKEFSWPPEAQIEFDHLKEIAGNLSFLSPYDETLKKVFINCDASKEGIGYVTSQMKKGQKKECHSDGIERPEGESEALVHQ